MKKLKDILKESNVQIGKVYSNPYATAFVKENEEQDEPQIELSEEQKKAFLEAVKQYKKYGEAVYRNAGLGEVYESIKNMVEMAGKVTISETDDWFDNVTVSRHMKRMGESFKVFEKTLKEVSTLQQRLEASYDEIGEVLGKYYEISEELDPVGKEDGDIDNDGDEDSSDKYLANRRKVISKAIKNESMKLTDMIKKPSVNEGRNFKKAKQALIDFNNGKIGEDDMVKSVVKSLGFKFDEFSEEEAGLELSSKIKKGKIPTDNYILNNVIDVLSESVNEAKYTNQTGIKSALMKDSNFSSLLNPKEIKWINGSDVKIYKGIGMNFSFTDGKSEMIVNVNKPMSIVKKLGKVGNDVKTVYQQNESVNESHFKVGDKVEMSHGGVGVIKSLDKEDGEDDEKYYNVELPNGDVMKHAPNELTLMNSDSVSEMQVVNKKTGKDVTKHLLDLLSGKIDKKEFEKRTGLKKESMKLTDMISVNEASEEFVVYIEKDNGRKKLLHTKKSQRAANMFLTKNADKILNQSGIRTIGSMSKFHWEKDEAQYAENIKKADMKTVTKKEWDRKHKDYKGMIKGQPYMMYMDKNGTTVYGPVNIKESVNEAQKVNPTSKKFLKGMKKIKVKGLGGWMPGVDYVYVDGDKYYFVDFEGDHMELKNTNTIKQLHKLHGKSLGESVNEAGDFAGWIAIFNGKKLEIDKSQAKDLYNAKLFAIKTLKVPKSKVGMLAIKPAVSEAVVNEAKYDIGMARKGNGITVYNRAEEEKGDYKNIAHISDNGVVKYYDKKLPNNVKKKIEAEAQKMKESVNEGKSMKLTDMLNESFGMGELPSSKLMKMKVAAKEMLDSVNENATRTAMEIGALTGMNKNFIQTFVDKHELDIEKVYQYVKKGKLKDRMDFVTALSGKDENPMQMKLINKLK